uniref:Cytosol aminopeptidase domain-containing protein n=1 Tax=Odontella aurita TaxID=265563 RepID=A0A7S4HRB2_9STRA|mmetsp:Transcript_1386/g.3819  ORF Transcript_1386/g.3819 Transcript_1386/m.3819 type:complete len:643 (+) Transcript_1386:92-2020(+)
MANLGAITSFTSRTEKLSFLWRRRMKTIQTRCHRTLIPSYLALLLLVGSCCPASCDPFLRLSSSSLYAVRSIRGGSYLNSQFSKKSSAFKTWSFDQPCDSMDWTPLPHTALKVSTIEEMEKDDDLIIVGVAAPSKEDDEEDPVSDENDFSPAELVGKAEELDSELSGLLSTLMKTNSKTFKNGAVVGSMTPIVTVSGDNGKTKLRRVALIGLGKRNDNNDTERKVLGRKIGSAVASACSSEKTVSSCSVIVPGDMFGPAALSELSTTFAENLYSDNRYRTGSKKKFPAKEVERVSLVIEGQPSIEEAREAISTGTKMALGVFLARDIVNSPHNVLNSISLADTAKRLAAESNGRLHCYILDKRDCEKRNMGAYLAVARGSETEPQFIHLVYKPRRQSNSDSIKKIGVVGKGLLFDTGGYNIKTGMMELMKFDCGGAAAVLGAARVVAALAPDDVEVHFVIAACENMINDRAVVPGDVLIASNGKTIEVINTDAEGRLTMADALVFVDKEIGCEKIVELSTLTGACMVALGNKISALYAADDKLASELIEVSKSTGEKVWRMPLEKEYNEQLESKIADIKNLGARYGGSITAALFLQNFVNKKKPFAHVDMAGPVWNAKSGATGYGAKLLTTWICQQGQSKAE